MRAVPFLALVLACARTASNTELTPERRNAAIDSAADARARQAAGCYELQAGPPIYKARPSVGDSASERHLAFIRQQIARLDSLWLKQDTFPFPRVVRLTATPSTIPGGGRYSLSPQPAPGSGFYSAAWGGSRDTLRLAWTMHDRMFSPVLGMSLIRTKRRWEGEARLSSDERSLAERFYRKVSARSVRCPPSPGR